MNKTNISTFERIRNKKGVFYLMLSSIVIMIFIVIFLTYKEYTYTDKQKVVETRINTINDFIKSLDADSKRVIYISGFRSLIAMEDYVARSGKYFNNKSQIEEFFRTAFYNGTVNGTEVDILENSTYSDYLVKLKYKAGVLGIGIDINVTTITLLQEAPWDVTVVVTTDINITDMKGLAKWELNDKNYSTTVSLINLRDPLYSVATQGRVPNPIQSTNITDFVNHATNDTSNLRLHINSSYYMFNNLSPSFLMRLQGDFNKSICCGIESLVDIDELEIQGIYNYSHTKSIVDYVFFTNITGYTNVLCNFPDMENMSTWFKIDVNHSDTYELTNPNLTFSPC